MNPHVDCHSGKGGGGGGGNSVFCSRVALEL